MSEKPEMTLLEARQLEVEQYIKNIALYESILATLPQVWPSHLQKYRSTKSQHEAAAEIVDLDDVELLSKLWYADECKKAIRSEMVEMTKAKAILAVLESYDTNESTLA